MKKQVDERYKLNIKYKSKNKMRKIIILALIATLLSSCALQFGDYSHYQKVHGNSKTCKY